MSLSSEEDQEVYLEKVHMWYPARYAISEEQRSDTAFGPHIVIILNSPLADEKYVKSLLSSGVQARDGYPASISTI